MSICCSRSPRCSKRPLPTPPCARVKSELVVVLLFVLFFSLIALFEGASAFSNAFVQAASSESSSSFVASTLNPLRRRRSPSNSSSSAPTTLRHVSSCSLSIPKRIASLSGVCCVKTEERERRFNALADRSPAIFDVLVSLFRHPAKPIRCAAMEIYVRRCVFGSFSRCCGGLTCVSMLFVAFRSLAKRLSSLRAQRARRRRRRVRVDAFLASLTQRVGTDTDRRRAPIGSLRRCRRRRRWRRLASAPRSPRRRRATPLARVTRRRPFR